MQDRLQAINHTALLGPSQLPWWGAVNDAARECGASVMLIGSSGNYTVSAGGVGPLGDLWSEQGAARWLEKAVAIGGISPRHWKAIGNVSIGSALPRSVYIHLLRITGRWSSEPCRFPLLREPWRSEIERRAEEIWNDPRPPRSFFEFRADMLMQREQADKLSLAIWGLDPRDPLSDRDLVDLCFSIPANLLVSEPTRRPLFEQAFGQRIAPRAIVERRRGYQSADWYWHFPAAPVRQAFAEIRSNPSVSELFDFDHIDRLIDRWPASGWERPEVIHDYRNLLLSSLAVGRFLAQHFPA